MERAAKVKRVGIIGYPLGHTLSPVMQQAALDFRGIAARYEVWETVPEEVEAAVARLRSPDCLGANVTVPHKQVVVPLLDEVDPMARRIGAVNTIVNRSGRLVGYNTDAPGFLRALERDAGYDPVEKSAVILGAGGAARAVAFALAEAGIADLAVANRRVERARELAEAVGAAVGHVAVRAMGSDEADLAEAVAPADLVINATQLGMRHTAFEQTLPIPVRLLRRELLVCDLVYNPRETPLLRAAQKVGAATLGGLPMLVYQGAAAFALWTGEEAPVGLMFERAREALRERG